MVKKIQPDFPVNRIKKRNFTTVPGLKFLPGDSLEDEKVRFWCEGGLWHCAVPRDDFATQHGFTWKRYGLIGRGATQTAALADWKHWQLCSKFVASIY